jgi:hypothetical protein
MKKITLISVVFTVMLLSSCSSRLVDFTVISSKNHQLTFDMSHAKQVSGSSMGFLAIGASIKDAMDKALQSAGPEYDMLINGVVRVSDYFFVSGYKVEGTAVSSAKLKAMLGEEGFQEWLLQYDVFSPDDELASN